MRSSSKYSRADQALVVQRAIAPRSALTPSEQALWALLRGGSRRLVSAAVALGRFIADFAALGARLVVEGDGGYHAERSTADAAAIAHARSLGSATACCGS